MADSDHDSDIDLDALQANWGSLAAPACVASQNLSQLTEEAEACHDSSTPSQSEVLEVDSQGSAVALKGSAPWWAVRLVQVGQGLPRKSTTRPWNVISGCTGVSSESFVLEAWADVSEAVRFSMCSYSYFPAHRRTPNV